MNNRKKVVLFLPPKIENSKIKTGLISEANVKKIEQRLETSKKIEFGGNIDFNKLQIVNNNFICGDVNLSQADLFFWFTPKVYKLTRELKALSRITKVIKDPYAYEIIADKFHSHTLLKKHGLPIPDFALVKFDNLKLMRELIGKWKILLIKPPKGSFGRGIVKVSDFETLRDVAGILNAENKQEYIFVEKFYENNIEEWISTTIINGKVIYGYRKRKEKFFGWKVYDLEAKGGGADYVDPAPVKELAEKAANILDRSIVGFDFISTASGYKLVDENNFPGIYEEAFRDAGLKIEDLILELVETNI